MHSMAEYSECLLEPLREGFDFTLYRDRGRGAFVGLLNSRACILLVLSLFLLPPCAWSQTQLAAVSGTITDPDWRCCPSASALTIVDQGTGLKRSAVTDTAGEYHFAGLPTGTYYIRVEKTRIPNTGSRRCCARFGFRVDHKFLTDHRRPAAAGNGQRERQRHRQYDLNCQRTRGRAKPDETASQQSGSV